MTNKINDCDRPKGRCYDCLIPYSSFPDLVIPNIVWEKINPTHHKGAGILCPTCISKRLRDAGAGDVHCTISAGVTQP